MLNFRQQLLKDALGNNKEFVTHLSDILNIFPETKWLQEEISSFFSIPSSLEIEQYSETRPYVDYRFEKLLLNNYRKFDKPKGEASYFSLPFGYHEKNAGSLFLLGDNGSGKSSLFNSMEYLFTGKIGEASYRNIQDLPWYVNRTLGKNPEIRVKTVNKEFSLSDQSCFKEQASLDVRRFFFSENSIYELSKYMVRMGGLDKIDWIPFFCYALGISDIMKIVQGEGMFHDIEVKLKQVDEIISDDLEKQEKEIEHLIRDSSIVLTTYAREKLMELKKSLANYVEVPLENLLQTVQNIYDLLPKDITYIYSINNFRDQLEIYIQNLQKQDSEKSEDESSKKKKNKGSTGKEQNDEFICQDIKQRIASLLSSIETMQENTEASLPMDEIFNKAKVYLDNKKLLDSKKRGIIKSLLEQLAIFRLNLTEGLEGLLKQYLDDDFLQLIRDVLKPFIEQKEGEHLCVEIMNKGTLFGDYGIEMSVGDIPVNKYFNTFRFRLFSLGIIAAFNFKSMKNERFLFPFVFDDIFYANDYKNKNLLFNFFEVLSNGAKNFLGDEDKLQIIFFTHDEQFVNTLFRKKVPFAEAQIARLLDCRFLKPWLRTVSRERDSYKVLKEFNRKKHE